MTVTVTTLPALAAVTLASAYDPSGNRTQLSAKIGATNDFINDYVYDNLDMLATLKQWGGSGIAMAEKYVSEEKGEEKGTSLITASAVRRESWA